MASSPSSVIDLTSSRGREGEAATTIRASGAINAGITPPSAPPEGDSAAEEGESVVSGIEPLHDSTNTAAAALAGKVCRSDGDVAAAADDAAPLRKKKRKAPPKSDGERCSICLDEWTSKGKHRICTLLCGHLFGKSCIERWLKERRSCPQCGAKVGSKGSNRIIPLFVQNLVAKDTGELETARAFLEEEKRLRKQCEAEKVRLSIENASLKDQLSRQSTSSMGKNPSPNPVGSGGGGYGFTPALVANTSTPSTYTSAMLRAGPSVGPSSAVAGYAAFAPGQRLGQRQGVAPRLSVPSPSEGHFMMGGGKIASPSPSWVTRPRPDPEQAVLTSGPGVLTGATRPVQAISSTQDGTPLLSPSGAGPAGGFNHSTTTHSCSEAPRQASSPTQTQAQTQGQTSTSPSPGSGIAADSRRERSTFPAAPAVRDVGADVGGLSPMPSGARNAGSATATVVAAAPAGASASGRAISPGAAAYSHHNPSPGDFRGGTGAGGGCGGGSTAEAAVAAAMSNGEVKVAVRTEHLLSRNVQAGRVVAFAGGAAGALLVSQEFGERRPQHGITKFSLADLRHHKNIHLHREQIRDMKFSGEGGNVSYVLSTGFDKTLKVCDLRTDSVVVSYDLEGNGWSCQWSAMIPTQMFCGVVDGTRVSAVQLFDLRSTAGAIRKLRAAARQRQPIHSICHTADDFLLCATMGGVWAWGGGTKGAEGGSGSGEEHAERLQIQAGPCCSLSGTTSSSSSSSGGGGLARQDRFLVSTRGSSASHAVFGLQAPLAASAAADAASGEREADSAGAEEGVGKGEGCPEEQHHQTRGVEVGAQEGTLKGDGQQHEAGQGASGGAAAVGGHQSWSKRWTRLPGVMQGHKSQQTLSRSLLWEPSPGAGVLIAGGDERTNQPWIWHASSGDVCDRLACHRSPVLDVASLQHGSSGKGLFAAVSQGEMNVYQTHVFDA